MTGWARLALPACPNLSRAKAGASLSETLIAQKEDISLSHEYEEVYLDWSLGRLILGDHYGDPLCALIGADQSWCAVGGEGLEVVHFDPTNLYDNRRFDLWRRSNPPPDGALRWHVTELAEIDGTLVRAVLENQDGVWEYEVDVRTLQWRPLRKSPSSW